jgi:hypothetical protein
MSLSVECPRCHTPCSLVDVSNGAPITCGNCQEVFAAEPGGDEAPRARESTPAKKKSSALLWILLIVGFVLFLPAFGTVGMIVYGFYWLDFSEDTTDPVIVGDAGPELPRMVPGFGAGPGGNGPGNPPKPKVEIVGAAAPRIQLECKDSEVREILFSNAKTNQAAVYSETEKGVHRVDRYDLGTKLNVAGFELIDPKPTGERKSLSPEGSLFAYEDTKDFVAICSAVDGRQIARRKPYEKKEKPVANEHEALLARMEFVAEDRLVTVDQAGGLDLWSMPDFEPIQHVAARTKSSFVNSQWGLAFSFDRKVLAVFNGEGFDLVNTATGDLIRKTGPLPEGGTIKSVCGVAFSADGSRLAALLGVQPEKGEPQAIEARYEVTTGKCAGTANLGLFAAMESNFPNVAWWGPKHLLAWGKTRNQAHVAEAETGKGLRRIELGTKDQVGRFAAVSPDNRLWYAAAGTTPGTAYLAAVEVPEDELRAGAENVDEPLLLTADGIGKKK